MPSYSRELERAFTRKEWVTVCWEPGCLMHRLDHWDAERWIAHQRRDGYVCYTHSICKVHARQFEREVQAFFARRAPAV